MELVKVKVKFPMGLTNYHVMKTLGEWKCSSTHSWPRH